MARVKAVLAQDVGKTIKWGANEPHKLDVNLDLSQFEIKADGSIHFKINSLPVIATKDARTGDVTVTNPDGTTVVLETPRIRIGVNDNWFIDGVDTGKPSRGLKGEKGDQGLQGVQGQSAYERAVANGFTGSESEWLASLKGNKGDTGETGPKGAKGDKGEQGNPFTYADFTPEQLAALKGPKGDKGNTGAKGDALRYEDLTEAQKAELKGPKGEPGQNGALDCAAIANLPNAVWKKGTAILATQDGECKKIVPNASIFQDVSVAITADRTVGTTNDTYHVTVTVTNSGESTNEVTDLNIVKPLLGTYTMSNSQTRVSTGSTIEKVSDVLYKIKKLATGSTAIVTFDVNTPKDGSYQFGAQINPNSEYDVSAVNNQASITLNVLLANSSPFVGSKECPLLEATCKGTPILIGPNLLNGVKLDTNELTFDIQFNIPVGTFAIYAEGYNSSASNGYALDSEHHVYIYTIYGNHEYSSKTKYAVIRPHTDNKFTGEFINEKTIRITATKPNNSLILFVKPKSNTDCQWQMIKLSMGNKKPVVRKWVNISGNRQDMTITEITNVTSHVTPTDTPYLQNMPEVPSYNGDIHSSSELLETINKVAFHKPGVYEFKVDGTNPDTSNLSTNSKGIFKVESTQNYVRVTVANNVTPGDNTNIKLRDILWTLEV